VDALQVTAQMNKIGHDHATEQAGRLKPAIRKD